jgi:hypothetical protein
MFHRLPIIQYIKISPVYRRAARPHFLPFKLHHSFPIERIWIVKIDIIQQLYKNFLTFLLTTALISKG